MAGRVGDFAAGQGDVAEAGKALAREFRSRSARGVFAAGGAAGFAEGAPGVVGGAGEILGFELELGDVEPQPSRHPEVAVGPEEIVGGGVALQGAFRIAAAVAVGLSQEKIGEAPHPAGVFVVNGGALPSSPGFGESSWAAFNFGPVALGGFCNLQGRPPGSLPAVPGPAHPRSTPRRWRHSASRRSQKGSAGSSPTTRRRRNGRARRRAWRSPRCPCGARW